VTAILAVTSCPDRVTHFFTIATPPVSFVLTLAGLGPAREVRSEYRDVQQPRQASSASRS
jgi:hypothetical protein